MILRLGSRAPGSGAGSAPMIAAPPSAAGIRASSAPLRRKTVRSAHGRCRNVATCPSAELLSIGTELTVGDTRDTNAGELARSLSGLGVRVDRLTALPDDLDAVTEAFRAGLSRADLVVSTGGLGPTPDDLTREAIAAACGETPVVDPELEAWLRELWSRRGMPFPELNLKQAWLIPSAAALPNPNGTAPGWFVTPTGRAGHRGDARAAARDAADVGRPRAAAPAGARARRGRGRADLSADRDRRVAAGRSTRRGAAPRDQPGRRHVRPGRGGRRAGLGHRPRTGGRPRRLVEETAATVLDLVGEHVWATGETTWSQAIGARLGELGWTLAAVEIGTAGALGELIGDTAWFRFDEAIAPEAPAARAHAAEAPDESRARCRRAGGRGRRRRPVAVRPPGTRAGWQRGRRGGPRAATHRRHGRFDRGRRAGTRAQGKADRVPDRTDRPLTDGAGRRGLPSRNAPDAPKRRLTDTWAVRKTLGLALAGLVLALAGCSPTAQAPRPPRRREPSGEPGASSSAGSPVRSEVTSMSPAAFTLVSTAFTDGGAIPKRFSCDGEDASPDLTWSGAPGRHPGTGAARHRPRCP